MHTRHPYAIWMIQMILFAGPLVLAATTAGLDAAAPSRVYKRMRGQTSTDPRELATGEERESALMARLALDLPSGFANAGFRASSSSSTRTISIVRSTSSSDRGLFAGWARKAP